MSGAVIAGLDPSLAAAAVVVGGPHTPPADLTRAVFKAGPPAEELVARLGRWRAHAANIRRHILEHGVTTLAIEGYSFGSVQKAAILGEFGGVLRMALLNLGIRIIEIPPTSLKKFVTGTGNANKTLVATTLARRCEVTYETDDEYDALGLWLMGRVLHDPAHARNRAELEIIGKLNGTA
jgi:Holliday junction resolvasome RuvABC endonuclease subunit